MKRLLISLLCCLPVYLFAQGYQLNLQGIRQVGMGGASIAYPRDAAGLFYNPGSAPFASNGVVVGVTPAISSGTFTDAASHKVSNTDNPVEFPFNASLLLGNPNGRLRYGLAVYTPFGSTMNWEKGFTGHYDVTKISLMSAGIQPTLSYKITDRLGIGIGFVYGYGKVDIEKDVPVAFSDGDFGQAKIKATAHSYGANAGIYYRFSDQFSAGVTYRSGLKMKTNKDGKINFMVPASVVSNFPDQKISAELPLPDIWGLGFAYKPNNKLAVALDVTTSNWKPYDTINIHYKEAPVAGEEEAQLIRRYKRAYSFKAGAEYRFSPQWEGRAGISYNLTPVREGYVAADVPDANRLNPAVGLSYQASSRLRVDAVFLFEHISRKDKNVITGVNGSYKFNLYIPGIGFSYAL